MFDYFSKKNDNTSTNLISAVIVAAGFGSRMKSSLSKYFIEILGRPIIAHTLEVFEESNVIDNIIIVTQNDDIVIMNDIVKAFSFDKVSTIVAGGDSRQKSVSNGIMELDQRTKIVLIHDGVRPFISSENINDCVKNTKKYNSAVLAVPSKDTLKIVDKDGFLCGMLDRENTYSMQTPQCFSLEIIEKAYKYATENNILATDDCTLVQLIGEKVKIVLGSYDNIKITTPEDVYIAESILRSRGELFWE